MNVYYKKQLKFTFERLTGASKGEAFFGLDGLSLTDKS